MNIGIYNYYQIYNVNNAIFKKEKYNIGNDLGYPIRLLKNELEKRGIALNTLDQYPNMEIDAVLFIDFPSDNIELLNKLKSRMIKLYLVIFECEIIKNDNWNKDNHCWFDKIFSWNSSVVDNIKYFRIFWPNNLLADNYKPCSRKLCTIIAGNKTNGSPLELYSKRIEVINWFRKHHSESLDVYGFGWNDGIKIRNNTLIAKIARKLLKIDLSRKNIDFLYKGSVENKIDVLAGYKFSVCFENARITDYITEKIFDCFIAHTIPIYYGDPDITKKIPDTCFIDMGIFNNTRQMYRYIHNMPGEIYMKYIDNIDAFLRSEQARVFSADNFVKVIIQTIGLEKANGNT